MRKCLAILFLLCLAVATMAAEPVRPNLVVILVDDAGFMDFGGYGGEARTPNINQLGAAGVRFSNYHTSPLCAPSRAMLLTGIDNHLTGMATIPEVLAADQRGLAGYSMELLPSVETVAERLRREGYRTYMTGKWHLGSSARALPGAQGFDQSFALDASGADNFEQKSYMPYYETAPWFENDQPAQLPEDFYSSEFIVDKMIDYLETTPDGQPYFAYLAFQAIHIPIQVPRAFTDGYNGVYDAGWDALRISRWEKAKALGLIDPRAPQPELPESLRRWETLTDEDKALYARSMQVNAGMLEAMDFHIGRLLDFLRRTGRFDNTLFVITSDNGPEFNDLSGSALMDLWMSRNGYSRELATLGERGSMAFIGSEWAAAASSPGSLFKFFATEGGLRVPLIVAGPGVEGGRFSPAFSLVTDIAPTLLQAAGASATPVPEKTAITGRSLVPLLEGLTERVYQEHEPVALEVSGNAALYKGDRKLRRVTQPYGDGRWRLFDARLDPAEVNDLAAEEPQRFQELLADYASYAQRMGVVEMPADFDVVAQVTANTAMRQLQFFRSQLLVLGFGAVVLLLGSALVIRQRRYARRT